MVQAIPGGYTHLIPQLTVSNATEAMAFYAQAFGAVETMRAPAPDGRLMHAEMTIGDSIFYVNDDFPEMSGGERTPGAFGGSPVTIHRFVEDVDAVVARAEAAGATVTMPPEDMFWGDRFATLQDPYGHEWSLATRVQDMTPEEMHAAGQAAFGGTA